MNRLPDAIFVIDSNKEQLQMREARKLGIPVVAVVVRTAIRRSGLRDSGQ